MRLHKVLSVLRLASLVLLGGPTVEARQGDMTFRLVQELKERLGLSDEQAAKVEALVRRREEKRKAVREADDPAAVRREMRQQMDETDTQIEALLTDAQKAKYAEIKAERRERMMKRREERRRGESPAPSPSASPSPKL